VAAATALVFTANVALVAPPGTVRLAGTLATVLLLERVMRTPPLGAGISSVTVPEEGLPPVTDAGFSANEESTGKLCTEWDKKFAVICCTAGTTPGLGCKLSRPRLHHNEPVAKTLAPLGAV